MNYPVIQTQHFTPFI